MKELNVTFHIYADQSAEGHPGWPVVDIACDGDAALLLGTEYREIVTVWPRRYIEGEPVPW